MGLQGYVGNAEDQKRIARYEKQRAEKSAAFEKQKAQSDANVDAAGLRVFGAGTSEMMEATFKNETVGLVTREEFLSKRDTLRERMDEATAAAKRAADRSAELEKQERQRKKAKAAAKTKLSFGMDDEEDEQEDEDGGHAEERPAAAAANGVGGREAAGQPGAAEQGAAARKLGKDPNAKTDFLPDREREAEEAAVRAQLKKEYELRQKVMKNEPLKITYSYWDGQGHRRTLTVRKGDTVLQFLGKVKEQLLPDFRDMRATSASSLMYVKEDLIIPHHISFYDLIVSKARGKSGPLFHFDVHEDIRVVNDASREKDESHAGKVVDRHWYNRNKHIFPASRWEVFDFETNYETYTTHGHEVEPERIWNAAL